MYVTVASILGKNIDRERIALSADATTHCNYTVCTIRVWL